MAPTSKFIEVKKIFLSESMPPSTDTPHITLPKCSLLQPMVFYFNVSKNVSILTGSLAVGTKNPSI